MDRLHIGCAGWTIPKASAEHFPADGTHLARYAGSLTAVEINTSFYRPHRPATYERWAQSVPQGFRFAVKLPKEITHVCRLCDISEPLARFLGEIHGLGEKLGPILVQLPPSLEYQPGIVQSFFRQIREQFVGAIVCEPRHVSWFAPEVDALLAELHVARVAADPAVVPLAAAPGGWSERVYYRWHGSPRVYYSKYEPDVLQQLASKIANHLANGSEVWCIFDNTALGAAAENALELRKMITG